MQKVSWYLNRIRVMSIREILTMRIYRFLRDILIKPRVKIPKELLLDIRPFGDEQREFYLTHFSALQKDIAREADSVMENRIKLFGAEIVFPKDIKWNRDFRTGKIWPLQKVNYHTFQAGDPKDIWELNRHQFLSALGKAFFLSKDEHYAVKALSIIESWIEQNPAYRGINWTSAFEAALRILSWLFTLKYISSSKALTPAKYKKICESLFRQADHIRRNLSLYSSANNHLIGELTALGLIGLSANQAKWSAKALHLLKEQVDLQLHPDGVGIEQSPFYHAHVMEYNILIALALKERGLILPEKIRNGLERGSLFLQSILAENGRPPQIGDNDSGEVLKLSSNYSNFKSILNLASFITGKNEHIQEDIQLDEKTFWLIGGDNFRALIERGKRNETNKAVRFAFPSGGYYILEKSFAGAKVRLIFDCGPLGMKPMAGHGHADALSFVLYVNGLPVLIDPGTYTYYKNPFWREYFRGTAAHNTIRVDGENQSEFAGEFLASYHAQSKCLEWKEGERVSGVHSGYGRLRNPVLHRRTISFEDQSHILRISDTLETRGPHLIEQFFHLNNHLAITESGENSFEIKLPQRMMTVRMDQSLKVTLYYGDEIIPLGWQSKSFGLKERSFSLAGRRRIASTTTLITKIYF